MEDTYDIEYEKFKQDVKSILGVDLNQYKPAQMKRRIRSFISKYKCVTLASFTELLKKNDEALKVFKDYITINVTEFFRNPEKFEELKTKVLPELIKNSRNQGRHTVRIWSAGCSTGAEAYTLAIIFEEHFQGVDYSVIGTDIDENIVRNAKAAEYKDIEIKNLNKYILDKYFDVQADKTKWKVKDKLKRNVKFLLGNLLGDTFPKGFDLILCRNVVIYFTEEAKDILYKKFYDSLVDNGVLFIGGTESILNAKQIGFKNSTNLFYYK
ncbi:MAG: protein-glutamate O-methyltransferase CheR [Candidatus Margulisbacteria bacterium]|nr:protein-glutamate O-methyltransferase CheR [Candidatus Margulisiibacteriota bacterium]